MDTTMTYDLDAQPRATRETITRTLHGYIECALWASTDDDGEPLDASYDVSDLDATAEDTMLDTVSGFLEMCWGDGLDLSALEPEQIGHDLWLTQNHHGAGFWDRGLGELGDALTGYADSMGEETLYVGDDGRLYLL